MATLQRAGFQVERSDANDEASDGTADEARVYDERSRQIAAEMAFLFSRVDAEVPRAPSAEEHSMAPADPT